MTSIFSKADSPHGSLREQPKELPDAFPTLSEKFENDLEWAEHERHSKTLRTIPCSENNFEDGKVYEEGKDYKVVKQFFNENEEWETLGYFGSAWDDFKENFRRIIAIPIHRK